MRSISRKVWRAAARILNCAAAALCTALVVSGPAFAAYDYIALGAPKFVNTTYIELTKISRISKFRSLAGHDYSDLSQFGQEAIKDRGVIERCLSMKNYFLSPDSSVKIYAPVSGRVGGLRDGNMGSTVEITSDQYPDFHITIFHVALTTPLAVGDHVAEGDLLGAHASPETWSDISVWVQTPAGKHLISYFEILTDAAFEPYKTRGIPSREALIRTKEERAADPRVCSFTGEDRDFVTLTGGATRTQIVTIQTRLPDTMNIGDAPAQVAATASSGLPVVFASATPRICTVAGTAVTPRRAGLCKVQAKQPGNDETIEAYPETMRSVVFPRGVAAAPPRLGVVNPPQKGGADSYIRFYNTGSAAGTVTATLRNGLTGEVVSRWRSPLIAPGASPQFSVSDMEGVLSPGYARPDSYSLKIEPETTIDGYLQHVLFDPTLEVITNASTCDVGTTTATYRLMNVHSSLLESAYPSTLIMFNHGLSTSGMNLTVRDAATGSNLGAFYSTAVPGPVIRAFPDMQINVSEAALERVAVPPGNEATTRPLSPPSAHLNLSDDSGIFNTPDGGIFRYFYQHLVTNRRPGVVSDFTTMCALNGKSTAAANPDTRASGLLSSLQPLAQSTLRFYNGGETAGTVRLQLYGNTDDQALGAWVSPEIPAGGVREFDIATIEREATPHRTDAYIPPALSKQNFYGLRIEAPFEGLFQNMLQTPGGAYTNGSACYEGVGTDQKVAIGVTASVRAAERGASTVVVSNTGAAPAAAVLTVIDARTGEVVGAFTTATIPANALIKLDAGAIEAAARIPADPARTHYVIKADQGFTGFLQHLVTSSAQGVVSDMTAACLL